MCKEEITIENKYTEWDVYLKGKSVKTVRTNPTTVAKAKSVIAEQEKIKRSDIVAVMAVLNQETK